MFDSSFKLLCRRLGLVLALYMLLRLLFYIFNYSIFSEAGFGQTILAFLHGLRFDIAAIIIINGLFILLSLFPVGNTFHPTFQKVLKWLFILTNAPFIALAVVDVEFFNFIGRRSTNELFNITNDIEAQIGQLASYYWYLVVGFIILLIALIKLYPAAPKHTPANPTPLWLRSLRLLLVIAFSILGIRGGAQLKPLRDSHAFVLQPPALGHLSLNSPFTFIKSIGKAKLEEKHYFATDEELLAALHFNPKQYTQPAQPPVKENVVIIILESFASEYVGALNNGEGYTPFLDSLASAGVLFQNNFANGRKSIEGLPSVLSGLPSLMLDPYIASPYQSNKLYSLGNILQEYGYRTAFFHGAVNGTMGFNNFSKVAGMQEYYGLDEYPSELRERNFDGQWGIFDEPYLQYVAKELNDFQQPFFTTLFTLSSHQPYTIPTKHKGRFPKGELEIHESIGYADHALREFFKTASQQPWYHNTLFILTADHTQKSIKPAYQNELGAYRVPLIIFHPAKQLEGVNPQQVTQQADIMPSLMDYLYIPTQHVLPFGHSVFDSSQPGGAIFFNGNSYFLVQQQGVTELTTDDQVKSYTFPEMAPAPVNEAQAYQLKAYVQYFRNKMRANDLYFFAEK
ncbi:LTA synthase family protein [Pontibacter harenae]|uniref:LTA synthase family protein n=1 Tax=Pontibacter harenae TaxID=2894083 RepID=UPI001E3727B4|nr:LTA synthase family protein [Pontibacter harenae]MCC9167942.1 LTA synthase family protein [Pontibacter harenae]